MLGKLGMVAAAMVIAIIGIIMIVNVKSNRRLGRRYDIPAEHLTIPNDSTSLARGEHLVNITRCRVCHGANLAGAMFLDDKRLARLAAPNLTSGQGGVARRLSDADWVRAIRHAVLPDGHAAAIMPAESYRYLSDADLGAMIAYLKTVPPKDASWPEPEWGSVGRALISADRLPFFPADSIDHARRDLTFPPEDTTAEYGGYLAHIAGCASCHNPAFSGGHAAAGLQDSPTPANLTPTGLAGWTEDDFIRVLRYGIMPDTRELDNYYMPWRTTAHMTRAEMHAIWKFLQTLPPKEMGQR